MGIKMQEANDCSDELTVLSKEDLCQRLNLSARTIENMVKRNDFPPPIRIGKKVYWSEKVVALWIARIFKKQQDWFDRYGF